MHIARSCRCCLQEMPLYDVLNIYTSHARTVVRECCKGDDESQWEMGKFDPPPPKNTLNQWSPKFVCLTTSAISTTMQNFIQIGSGLSVLRMRDFAPLGKK